MMEHTKKLLLVPSDTFERMQEARPPVKTTVKSNVLSSLDHDMQAILNRKDLSEHDKFSLYNDHLQRYLHFFREKDKPFKVEITSPKEKEDEEPSKKNRKKF